MKTANVLLCPLLFTFSSLLGAMEITADLPIVPTAANGTPEQEAPEVLRSHLSKIFGREVAVIPASEWKEGSPAIVLKSDPALDQEEWKIENDGKVLTISGGWPRGLYYGVCEFLEKFGGVRWFTAHETRIPRAESLTVPDNECFRRKPAFPLQRQISIPPEDPAFKKYRALLKVNSIIPWESWPTLGKWPYLFESRGVNGCHNFWKLTRAVPEGMERLLPVDSAGRPQRGVSNVGPNQVCFSSPEFREFAKKEIAKEIAEEEEKAKKKGFIPQWFDLSQNDTEGHCQCEGCRALYEKYGSPSGAMLEFVNDIASAFPDHTFMTFAYQFTEKPPKGIRVRDNVVIQTAFLGSCDHLRPISHPNNAPIREMYDQWKKISKNKAVWAYDRLYYMTEAFPWPQCCYWNIAENVRYYHQYGAVKLYLESEHMYNKDTCIPERAFNDLHSYLGCKLMDDPYQDDKVLIEEFFQFQYGPAVSEMKAYADYLKRRIDAVPGKVHSTPLKARGILDAEFFVIVNTLLDRAEAKAGNDAGLLTRIAMERIPVDCAALEMWNQGGSASGISRGELITRLKKDLELFFERYQPELRRPWGKTSLRKVKEQTFATLDSMRKPLPIPPEFAQEDVIQVPVLGTCEVQFLVDDPEAALGKAEKMDLAKVDPKYPPLPMEFGVYDYVEKKYLVQRVLQKEDIPQDEKYHLILIGRVVPNGFHRQMLYGHSSWRLRIAGLFSKLWDPIDGGREYDIYISCKFTGPAYVAGSTKENAVYADKLLAVKRGIQADSVK